MCLKVILANLKKLPKNGSKNMQNDQININRKKL